MHLEQDILNNAQLGSFVIDSLEQVLRVHGLDEVRPQFEQVAHFVGLQMSDEVPMDVRRQLVHFGFEFLHTALAEMAFSGFVRFAYGFDRMIFAYAYERHTCGYMRADVPYIICYRRWHWQLCWLRAIGYMG